MMLDISCENYSMRTNYGKRESNISHGFIIHKSYL